MFAPEQIDYLPPAFISPLLVFPSRAGVDADPATGWREHAIREQFDSMLFVLAGDIQLGHTILGINAYSADDAKRLVRSGVHGVLGVGRVGNDLREKEVMPERLIYLSSDTSLGASKE